MFTGDTLQLARMMAQERTQTLLKEQQIWLLIGKDKQQPRFYQQILTRGVQWLQQQLMAQGRSPATRLNGPIAAAGGGD